MGRPRQALWESPDKAIYIKAAKGAFVVVDTRGIRREAQRSSFAHAVKFAEQIGGAPPPGAEPTFFELALDYFERGLPVWDDGSGVALSEGTIEDRKGIIRNHYAFVGNLPLSQIPNDVLRVAVDRIRRRPDKKSKSLQDKVLGVGKAVLRYGRQTGAIPADRAFPEPIQRVKTAKVDQRDFVGRVMRPLPSNRSVHRFARLSAARSGAPYMRLFWWLAAYIGFREGELCALAADDVTVGTRVRISVTKKAIYRRGRGDVIEPYAKGREHRTVTVPRLLERPLLARVAEVRAAGGSLLFPSWTPGRGERPITYTTLKDHFVTVGAEAGWKVINRSTPQQYTAADGRTRTYRGRPSSLEYTIHDLRAFAATSMYDAHHGISLRGMNMSLKAVAAQLGDNPEVVKSTYLGIREGNAVLLDSEVP